MDSRNGGSMENIENYDSWKLDSGKETLPADHYDCCGEEMYSGSAYYDLAGDKYCEDCLKQQFEKVVP